MNFYQHYSLINDYDPNVETWDEYLNALYHFFLLNYVERPLRWKQNGQTVSMRKQPEIDGRHAVFWHIISGGTGEEASRQIEPQRCVRLGWIRQIIESFNLEFPDEITIRWWEDTKRSFRPRYVITRQEFDYVVVIEQRDGYALLVTAYFIEHDHRRRKLRKDHDAYWAKQEPPTK